MERAADRVAIEAGFVCGTRTGGEPLAQPFVARQRPQRSGEGWQIVRPLDFPADEFALDGIASALAQAQSEARYEEPQPLAVYGLDAPAGEIRFGAGEAEHALRDLAQSENPVKAKAAARELRHRNKPLRA